MEVRKVSMHNTTGERENVKSTVEAAQARLTISM
jgi:hypothetical protein